MVSLTESMLKTFVEVVIHGDYEAAIEAFTVIEEAVGDLIRMKGINS